MPLPAGISTVTVTGLYQHPDGSPMRGTVSLIPTPQKIVSASSGVTVQGPAHADLVSGAFSLTVVATDSNGINPTGFTYEAVLSFADAPGDVFPLSLPKAAATVSLNAVTPAAQADEGTYLIISGPQPPLGAAGAGDTIALKSTDPSTTNARTPTAHAASHAAAGSDPVTLTQAQITGLAQALAALAALSGATFTGDVTINGANLVVKRAAGDGAYRFRTTGGGLDLELGGLNVFISAYQNADFTGTQSNVMRLEPAGPHLIGRVQYGTGPFDTVHNIDSGTGVAAVGAKNGLTNIRLAGFKNSAGAPTTGTWTTGDVVLDAAGAWHLCTAGGTPGTWT